MDIQIKTMEVAGLYPALMGMRNPKNSWNNSDTEVVDGVVVVGNKDLTLARNLVKRGAEHAKFLRQIQVWADLTLPRYMWQEFDTYKFGTKNSCSTMHTLHQRPFSIKDFYFGCEGKMFYITKETINKIVDSLNYLRDKYQETTEYAYVIEMKRILPESFLQLRSWNSNYAEILNMYRQRQDHKLVEEWVYNFCRWVETLPYFSEICL